MKIAITTDPEIPVPPHLYGGIERMVAMLIDGLQAKGHSVTLFANSDSKVPCQLVAYRGKTSRSPWDSIQNMLQVSQVLFSGYDVVHSFGRLAYLTALLPSRIPKIMSYQREPSLLQVKRAVQLAKAGTLVFTGCSEYIARQIRPIAHSFAIPNGAPIEKYTFMSSVSEQAPLIFLGRIEEIKGTHIAIKVALKTGRKLIIAGNIPAEKQGYFNTQIKPHVDGQQIVYVGPVNDTQKNELLGKAVALLMPIQWNEPFGIVMAEALACGTPVIGFGRGSVPEIVQDGVNGFVCQTVNEMVEAVLNLNNIVRHDCRRIAESKFSNAAVTEQYIALYNKIKLSL
jgi:glycosyltransferase involved in cell wall biosynthesis